jgi:hypothetical protein
MNLLPLMVKEEEAGLTLLLADHGREGAYAMFFFSLSFLFPVS